MSFYLSSSRSSYRIYHLNRVEKKCIQPKQNKMSPDERQHRGAHPADTSLFADDKIEVLRRATDELSWLLGRRYSPAASLKLVGDRYRLAHRQRLAISRAACADHSREKRAASCRPLESVAGERLIIDGFNLIITVEAALNGGVLMICRDGCIRDLSSVHGSYRSVQETECAISLIGEALVTIGSGPAEWLFDKPVSNSGRLAQRVNDSAIERGWKWAVKTVFDPDAEIMSSTAIAVTSDSVILAKATRWINLSSYLIQKFLPQAWVIDLRT